MENHIYDLVDYLLMRPRLMDNPFVSRPQASILVIVLCCMVLASSYSGCISRPPETITSLGECISRNGDHIGPFRVSGYNMTDDGSNGTTGNGDGVLTANETVHLFIMLENAGPDDAENVYGTMSSSMTHVAILDPQGIFRTVPGRGKSINSPGFLLEVKPSMADYVGYSTTFRLSLISSSCSQIGSLEFYIT